MSALLVCLGIHFSGYGESLFIYDREHANQWWRFASASFVHYDLYHLLSNLLVFAAVAAVLESSTSTTMVLAVIIGTAVLTVPSLHFLLPEYRTFAGISCISYAIFGYLLMHESRGHVPSVLLVGLLLGLYELTVVLGGAEIIGSSAQKPVWQLHLIALLLGVVFCFGRRYLERHKI
ncbi:MAG: membrane associated rhomboid family serine protease [Halieaceae bacterium]|jgi:membrane associated rhomboid family serine protease